MLKQILLITDGCSNSGLNPIVAATHALQAGVTVNVVGVVENGEIGRNGVAEVEAIARAGGGLSRIVAVRELAQTVQMLTRKTVAQTIKQVVQEELKQVFVEGTVESLSPAKRAQVVQVMDNLSETTSLRVCMVIDTSASMRSKLSAVEDAVRDLALSLGARSGKSEIAVMHFPAAASDDAELDVAWTSNSESMKQICGQLSMSGVTPTGPAIMKAVQYITNRRDMAPREEEIEREMPDSLQETGLLQDYVV